MPKKFENGLFIFRRDYRIVDNNGLHLLHEYCSNIFTVFIFTPEQVGQGNKYKSNNSVQFMIESLQDLENEISKKGGHLYIFYGGNNTVIEECIRRFSIDIVCFNLDVSPYARERDASIIKLCEKMETYVMYDYDYYLHEPGTIVNGQGLPYQKFTPYYESSLKKPVPPPKKQMKLNLSKMSNSQRNGTLTHQITLEKALHKFTVVNPDILVHGGRSHAIQLLKQSVKTQKHYDLTQHELDKPTSYLSAYINFGCLSIREVYSAFKSNKPFIRQLIWGSFYANILYNYPDIIYHSFKPKYDKIKWHNNEQWFQSWCRGTTNFPVVDACMRELNKTGFMHGRGRLIVASFLVKTMLIDYKKGEKYFAKKLTDYNITNNLNNWMWITGNGAASQEYFRIFNPWLQSKEHDPDCEYIKKWVPELKDVPAKDIHQWNNEWSNYKDIRYGKPICDYEEQKVLALQMYHKALK